jgi:hypothetical protein
MSRALPAAVMALASVFAARLNAQDSTLTKWFEQARPQLEKRLGYSLPETPKFELATRGEFSDPGVIAHLHWRFPHLRGEILDRAKKDVRSVSDSATLARLVEGKNVIRIGPDIRSYLASGSAKGRDSSADADLFVLALTHELVRHALDVRYDLTRRREACRDAEEWFALQAIVEGRAQQVTRQLASDTGMEKAFPRLAERFLHVPDVSPDPGLRTSSQSAMRQLHWAYTRGRQFWEYLEDQGMKDIEKDVFAHPPRLTQWIENPVLHLRARKAGRDDLATIMSRLDALRPAGEWTSAQQAWTPTMVIQAAEAFGDKSLAEKRVEGWQEGRCHIWTSRANAGRLVSLSVARFQNPNSARAFFNFTLDLERKADEKLNISESRCRTAAVKGADEAVLSERRRQNLTIAVLRLRTQEQFLEWSWYGTPADVGWAEEVLRLVTK